MYFLSQRLIIARWLSCTADPELHCQGVGGGCFPSVGLKCLVEGAVLKTLLLLRPKL